MILLWSQKSLLLGAQDHLVAPKEREKEVNTQLKENILELVDGSLYE